MNAEEGLKIVPMTAAYYYLLNPRDWTFKFFIEGNNLRAELDRNYVATLLRNAACSCGFGAKGRRGLMGRDGSDGDQGPAEKFWLADIETNDLTFEADVPAPLDTPISIRLIQNNQEFAEIIYGLDGSVAITEHDGFENGITSTAIVLDGEKLSGVITATKPWEGSWYVKARQVGPIGWAGEDGETFIEIAEEASPHIRSNKMITDLRNNAYDIFFTTNYSIDDLPSPHLRPHSIDLTSYESGWRLLTWAKYGALEPTIAQGKSIRTWEFDSKTIDKTDLALPDWTPDPSCLKPDADNIVPESVEFGWWSDESGIGEIIKQPEELLPEKCCQEDFFFCPLLGPCPPSE